MTKAKVLLGSVADVKDFVNQVNRTQYEVDLVSGRYIVDAKSIMGIFSLDLSKPIELRIHSDSCKDLMDAVSNYLIKD